MPQSKTLKTKSANAKCLLRRRLLVERLENRVVLTGQIGLSPFVADLPYLGNPSTAAQEVTHSADRFGDIATHPTIGSHLRSGEALREKAVGSFGTAKMSEPEFVPGRWITRFDGLDGAADQQVAKLQEWISEAGLAGIAVSAPLGLPGMVSLQTSPDLSYDQLSASLSGIPGFQYASQDYKVWGSATYPNDDFFPEQYAQDNTGQDILGTYGVPDADIDAPEAWDLTTGSSSVVVGVIDSGIDFTHPDLIDNIWTNPNEIAGNEIDDDANGFIDDVHGWDFWGSGDSSTDSDDDNDPSDENGHGTHVSGTIGASGSNQLGVAGVAWDVSIVPLRFIGPYNWGYLSDAVRAINYATSLRTSGVNLKVTNNSWGGDGYYDQALVDAIAANEAAGILFVAAAGNDYGNNNDGFYPAYPASYDLDNIISVAATDNQDQLAYFSNVGPTTVDLGAPGTSILSTVPGGYYEFYDGTSMATPQVTGVAALAWSLAPNATYQEVKEAILAGVDPVPALQGLTLTGGRLNAFNTLKKLGIQVTSTDPAVNEVVSTKPTQYVVDFSFPYDPASIEASDFTVNGQNADGFVLTDLDTITFTFSSDPVTIEGEQMMAIAPGAINPDPAAPPLPFLGFDGTFRYDSLLLQVVSTTPLNPGGVFTLPAPLTYDVQFNEAIDPDSVTPSDLVLFGLQGATASNVTVSADGRTATFTIAGIRDEGTLSARIAAGAITDVYGNTGEAFSAEYMVDYGTVPFPVPLNPVAPLGSLIYDATQRGIIDPAGDTDSFTIKVDPGQTITALVEVPGTLSPTIKLLGPDGSLLTSSTATEPGQDALIQTYRVPGRISRGGVESTYTVVVGGADGTIGSYKLHLLLNAAVEPENNSGSTNNSLETAFDIGNSFLSLTNAASNSRLALPERGGLVGQVTAESPIVPNSRRDGGPVFWGNAYPFVLDPFGIESMRYQQIYSADQFPNGGLIDEIRFRRELRSQTITDLQLDIEIRLSYSARGVSTASSLFADNVGSDVTTVFDGPLTISSTSTTYPLPFDAVIDVDDKFYYDPSRGDLLVDFFVRDSSYPFPAYFESTLYPTQDLATTRIFSFSVDDQFGIPGYYSGENLPYGLVTQIAFDTPPDPVDWYKFELRSRQSATVALSYLTGDDAQVTLVGPTGTTLAVSSPNQASNVDQIISNFIATSSGTYYLKVTSKAGATYSLVVDRNADFDAENNNSIATAQELIVSEAAANRWVHGYLGSNTISVNASSSGWFDSDGYHDQFNPNYFVGSFPGREFRNFFVFDLPEGDLNVIGGQLVLTNPAMVSGDETETYVLFDVNTPIDQLTVSSFGRTDIFDDLGSGTSYGSKDVPIIPFNDRSRLTTVNLGASGISAIKAHAGGQLALGGAITTLSSFAQETLFGGTGSSTEVRQLQLEVAESDFYKIRANNNRTIVIETSTPASDSGEFVNKLDPIIRLYDPTGNLVATNDNGASDGRNAKLTYKIPRNAGGDYSVEIAASSANPNGSKGEYILSVKGSSLSLPGFEVTDTDPSAGSLVYTSPQQIEVNFNDTLLASTLQGSDLRLNGNPAATASLINGDTVQFQNNLAFQWTTELGGNGKYYALTSGAKTWQASQAEAVSLGGNLVTVNSQLEQNFLKRVFFSGPDNSRSFWIGLNDIAEEGNFVWASGEPLEYTNWTPGEPNNLGIEEDGVQINFAPLVNNGSWNDLWDTFNIYGIIELEALPSNFALAKEGLNTFSIAAGAITDIQRTSLATYSGSFTLDTTPPVVTSTSISPGEVASEGEIDLSVTFSEAMDTSPFGFFDFPVYGQYTDNGTSYYPYSAIWSADGKTLTLSYDYLPEDAYELGLFDDYLQDLSGLRLDGDLDLVEGGGFVLKFYTDSGTREIPTPLEVVQPVSSLIYQTPYAAFGTVVPDSDTDDWTIYLDPTQTLTVLLDSNFTGLVGTVEVLGPDGSSLGSAAGSDPFSNVLLQTVRATSPGVYTVRIGGADGSAGMYAFELTVNAALEEEAYGGPPNNEVESAQSIEASFIPLVTGPERGAVRGVSGDDDFYAFELTAGQSLNASLSFDSALQSPYGRTDYYTNSPFNVVFGDVNNDGSLDMVTSTGFDYYSQFSIRLGLGDGTFSEQTSFGPAYSYRVDLVLADVNGDNFLDVIAADYDGGFSDSSITVQLGNGDGTFQDAVGYFAGYYNISLAVGDVTGDGKLDIVSTNDVNGVYLLPGNGDGTFGDYVEYQVGDYPGDIALADVDGQYGLDIITANYFGGFYDQSLSILLNQGGGTFGEAVHYSLGYYNTSVAVGDLNGDGAPDIVTTSENSNAVQVLFNSDDGTGSFEVPVEYLLSGYYPRSIELGDVNGDSILDIVTGSIYDQYYSNGVVSILANSGDGSFGSAVAAESAYGTFGIALGDLNGDGKLDIAAAGYYSYTVSVLLNISTPPVLTLFGPDGTELISSDAGDAELDVILSGFVATESGTYTIRQTSPPFARDYSLIVTRELVATPSAPRTPAADTSKETEEFPLVDSKREFTWFNQNRPTDNPTPTAKRIAPELKSAAVALDSRIDDELWSDLDQAWILTERDWVPQGLADDIASAWLVDSDEGDRLLTSARRKSAADR